MKDVRPGGKKERDYYWVWNSLKMSFEGIVCSLYGIINDAVYIDLEKRLNKMGAYHYDAIETDTFFLLPSNNDGESGKRRDRTGSTTKQASDYHHLIRTYPVTDSYTPHRIEARLVQYISREYTMKEKSQIMDVTEIILTKNNATVSEMEKIADNISIYVLEKAFLYE